MVFGKTELIRIKFESIPLYAQFLSLIIELQTFDQRIRTLRDAKLVQRDACCESANLIGSNFDTNGIPNQTTLGTNCKNIDGFRPYWNPNTTPRVPCFSNIG